MPAQRKYPEELRERAVKMVFEVRDRDGKWTVLGILEDLIPGKMQRRSAGKSSLNRTRPAAETCARTIRPQTADSLAVVRRARLRLWRPGQAGPRRAGAWPARGRRVRAQAGRRRR